MDDQQLPDLLELKYKYIADAVKALGDVKDIREVFIGFQEGLYSKEGEYE